MTLASVVAFGIAAPLVFSTFQTAAGPVTYTVLTPEGEGPHPAILALPPGSQTKSLVADGLAKWQEEMVADGYLVLSPVAPDSGLFTSAGSYSRLPALMDHVAREHSVKPGGWILFGISNGGRSALEVGAAYVDRFLSVTVLPGATSKPQDLKALTSIPVTLAVGSEDGGWLESSQQTAEYLNAAGGDAKFVVIEGQGHSAFRVVDWATLKGWMTRGAP